MLEQTGMLPLIIKENITESEKQKIISAYSKKTVEDVFGEVKAKKVIPFAAKTFSEVCLDTEFWKSKLEFYRERNKKILELLDTVYSTLEKYGVKKMFVTENFGALLSADGDIGLFASGDVDNCADYSEKQRIYAGFEELGFERCERFALKNHIATTFHPHNKEIGEDFYISVDFHPLARLKLPCFVNADDFIDWDKLYCYKDTCVKLAPVNSLMYICMLHISLHSFSRAPDARLYMDIINLSKLSVDWKLIMKWAKKDNTKVRLSTSANIANRLFGVEMPEDVLSLSKRCEKVLKQVYDENIRDLIYEPKGLKVLRIEALCDDNGIISCFIKMAFPDKTWVKQTYGSSSLISYIKHIKRII